MTQHYLAAALTVPAEANLRFAEASSRETLRADAEGWPGYRRIGGDHGDLYFSGYEVGPGTTTLLGPVLVTTYGDLSDNDAVDIAQSILSEALNSIGAECVEHN